ncbi:YihY/virulence factor BrkB family protein [Salinithrix halophila]|uniref:YihY/virulence factor BrkB family protein n=1 Tax=Salinithrix halophila TaxID=1485204 RepID=A0ABV8JC15_9BACL
MTPEETKRKIWPVMKNVYRSVMDDGVIDLAAALAYYFLLSIFPLLIFIVSLLPYFSIDPDEAIRFVKEMVPRTAAESIDEPIREILSQRKGGLLSFSLLATLWIASNGVSAMIRMLNIAYQVEESRNIIRARLLSLALTVGIVLVFAVMLTLQVFGKLLFGYLDSALPLSVGTELLFGPLRWAAAVVVTVLVLIAIYQIAPNMRLPLREVVGGAIAATLGWHLISLGFSYYVNHFNNYSGTYGSLGGIIVLMVWFYLTALILIMGGVINAAVHQHRKERNGTH